MSICMPRCDESFCIVLLAAMGSAYAQSGNWFLESSLSDSKLPQVLRSRARLCILVCHTSSLLMFSKLELNTLTRYTILPPSHPTSSLPISPYLPRPTDHFSSPKFQTISYPTLMPSLPLSPLDILSTARQRSYATPWLTTLSP